MSIVKIKKHLTNQSYNPALFMYGHFITDCLIMEIILGYYRFDVIYRKNNIFEMLGYLKPLYEDIFECELIEVTNKEYTEICVPEYFSPVFSDVRSVLTKDNLKFVNEFLTKRYNLTKQSQYPKVIFIERSKEITFLKQINKSDLENNERKELTNRIISSTKTFSPKVYSNLDTLLSSPLHERRSIEDETAVIDLLRNHFADNFATITLENLSFREQLQYFRHAEVIIGCHGAGIINTIFSMPNATVIEYIPEYIKWNSFESVFSCLEVKHIQLRKNDKIRTNLEIFAEALQQYKL